MNQINGLSSDEVKNQIEKNLINKDVDVKTKSIKIIITENIFTLFNLLNFILALALIYVHSYKNLLFFGVVICNSLISIIQEIRSKKTIDKLSLLKENKIIVIRDGLEKQIDIHSIVKGDVCKYNLGNQIVADSQVISGEVLVNESLLTGESEPETKTISDTLLSGSFIVSGMCYAKVINVAQDNYTAKISSKAKYIKKVNSEIMNFINKIIKAISISIIPIGLLLLMHQLNLPNASLNKAVVNVVAALIGMIPEGLVLLTSTVLAVSVIRLSKYNVLVQELYCIETLARVDTICLDKTGTITEGKMLVNKIVPLDSFTKKQIEETLGYISFHMEKDNQTMIAISDKYERQSNKIVNEIIPFSSRRKWSGISFEDGNYILGAPDILLKEKNYDEIDKYVKDNRVVLLAKTSQLSSKELPNKIIPMGLIIIEDKIRPEAKATLEYFDSQGVDIKIISGDNPKTVASIANKVGLKNIKYIDMSKEDVINYNNINDYNVFGRVKPNQKEKIIKTLQKKGHTVAMTGDGVNDVLALKQSDCAIAMNSGSDAARNVAQLVLLNSNFSSLPKVVSEGRRSINNLQRSSSLFLNKTIYAALLALIFLFRKDSYPFIPIQLTLVSMVTIGIPSFILALEQNKEKINGKIVINVLRKSLPTALTTVTNILIISFLPNIIYLSSQQVSTLCVILTGITGFMLIYRLCVPFNTLRRLLFSTLITMFVLAIIFFKNLFSLTPLNINLILLIGILSILALVFFNIYSSLANFIANKIKK